MISIGCVRSYRDENDNNKLVCENCFLFYDFEKNKEQIFDNQAVLGTSEVIPSNATVWYFVFVFFCNIFLFFFVLFGIWLVSVCISKKKIQTHTNP